MSSNRAPGHGVRRLSDIVREARIAAAERADAAANLRDADRARLELLAEELKPVFDDVPRQDDQFDFFLSSGERPRLLVDAIAQVHMGTDRRTYRFVRDTRHGREVVVETADMMKVADSVTRYIAERIVQRQRFLDSDSVSLGEAHKGSLLRLAGKPQRLEPASSETTPAPAEPAETVEEKPVEPSKPEKQLSLLAALLFFCFGAAVMGAAMAVAFWEQIGPIVSAL